MATRSSFLGRALRTTERALSGSAIPIETQHSASSRRDPRAQVRRRERFLLRARALSFTRFLFLGLGLLIVFIPAWSQATGLTGLFPKLWLVFMIAYTVTNVLLLRHVVHAPRVTFVTLNLDLLAVVFLVGNSGGLHSPALDALLLLTLFFGLLFPHLAAVAPPLVALLIAAALGGAFSPQANLSVELFTLIWYSALSATAFALVVYLTSRQEAQQLSIAQLERELKNFAVLDERNRLSREIHDGLGAALSGLIIQTEYIMTLTRDRDMRAELDELKEAAEDAIAELRRALSMMRDEFELVPSLRATCETFRTRHKLPCEIEILGQPPRLSSEQQLTIFRILQETLHNASKHARAKRVTVRVQFFVDGLSLRVIDDGVGFDLRQNKMGHYGLTGMRDRARKVGGDVMIESELGEGTAITFSLRGIGGEATTEAAIPVRFTAQRASQRG